MIEETKPFILDMITAIMQDMTNDNPYATILNTDLLLKTIEPKWIKQHGFDTLQADIDNFLANDTHYRLVRMNTKIKSELEVAIEYLDKDIGNDERLFYQTDLESDLRKLMADIRRFLAMIIKTRMGDDFTLT